MSTQWRTLFRYFAEIFRSQKFLYCFTYLKHICCNWQTVMKLFKCLLMLDSWFLIVEKKVAILKGRCTYSVKNCFQLRYISATSKFFLHSRPWFQVRTEDGLGLAEYWSCPFTECSAKNAHNVNTVFAEIVREMNYVQTARMKQNQGCCALL